MPAFPVDTSSIVLPLQGDNLGDITLPTTGWSDTIPAAGALKVYPLSAAKQDAYFSSNQVLSNVGQSPAITGIAIGVVFDMPDLQAPFEFFTVELAACAATAFAASSRTVAPYGPSIQPLFFAAVVPNTVTLTASTIFTSAAATYLPCRVDAVYPVTIPSSYPATSSQETFINFSFSRSVYLRRPSFASIGAVAWVLGYYLPFPLLRSLTSQQRRLTHSLYVARGQRRVQMSERV